MTLTGGRREYRSRERWRERAKRPGTLVAVAFVAIAAALAIGAIAAMIWENFQ